MSRVIFSTVTTLVLCCALAAQTSSQSSSSASQTSNPDQTQTTPSTQSTTSGQTGTQSDQMSSAGQSGTQTISGCLSGPNQEGAYMLRSSRGHEVEVGGSSDLSANVGKQVSLTGKWAKSGSEIGEREENKGSTEQGTSTTATGEHKEHGERHFQVSSVQKIADTCESSGSSSPK